MKLLRHGALGAERPAVLDVHGNVRDLSALVEDITPLTLGRDGLRALASINTEGLPVVERPGRLGVPWAGLRKFIAIGLSGPNDPIVMPYEGCKLDWEVELGIVIGQRAQGVSVDIALNHVAGYCMAHDVSDRHYQFVYLRRLKRKLGFASRNVRPPMGVSRPRAMDGRRTLVGFEARSWT